jgi:hypothetical protein
MNTHESNPVAERFAALAPRPLEGDWGDVLSRAGADRAAGRWQVKGFRALVGSRRRRVVALAAVALVMVGTASGLDSVRDLFFDYPGIARKTESRTIEGVRFSFTVPRSLWENGPTQRIGGKFRNSGFFLSTSTVGGQAAEAVIFWTGLRDNGKTTPCTKLLGSAVGGSSADLAAAVARAPGTELLSGPTRVSMDGRPAHHVVLIVREDLGCEPGYFFSWRPRHECWGACWLSESSVGNTIRVWIVDVGGTRLFIGAETRKQHARTGEPVPRPVYREVEQDIAKIVGSIRFG